MNMSNPDLEIHNKIAKKYGKYFCAAPFTSFHEGENGLVSTCCKTRNPLGYTDKNTLEEILNSEEAQKIRKEFLEGKKPEQCRACWKLEDGENVASNRKFSNVMGEYSIDKAVEATDENGYMHKQFPTWVDLLWTNKCNFACLGCKPSLSTTIAKSFSEEYSILHNYEYTDKINWNNKNDHKIDYIVKNSDYIHTIHLNGGEPLMADDLYEFLDVMIKKGLHKKIKLWSHTNGSVKTYKGNDLILDYFSQWGDNCKITISNDGHGDIGSYIRYGYRDNKWLETYNKIVDRKINHNVQTCINIFNILYLKEIHDWYIDNLHSSSWGKLSIWSNDPINIRMTNFVPELREQAIQVLDDLDGNNKMTRWDESLSSHKDWLIKSIDTKKENLQAFYNGVVALDKKRKTNFLETFPKLEPLYNLGSTM